MGESEKRHQIFGIKSACNSNKMPIFIFWFSVGPPEGGGHLLTLGFTTKHKLMKIRIRLSFRVLLVVLGTVSLVIVFAARSINNQFRASMVKTISTRDAIMLNSVETHINNIFKNEYQCLQTVKSVVEATLDADYADNEEVYKNLVKDMCESSKVLAFAWVSFDNAYAAPYDGMGRRLVKAENKSYGVEVNESSIEYEFDELNSVYYSVKESNSTYVAEPDFYQYDGSSNNRQMKVALAVPIEKDENFCGVLGIDINIDKLRSEIDTISLKGVQSMTILSAGNMIVDYPEKDLIGQQVDEINSALSSVDTLSSFVLKNVHGADSTYNTVSKVNLADLGGNWTLIASTSTEEIDNTIGESLTFISKVILLGLIILGLLIFGISIRIVTPIKKVNSIINKLSLGQVGEELKMAVSGNDELGQMADSSNKVVEGLLQVTKFAENIGNGNSNYKFTPLSDRDVLGNAIIEMKNSLDKAKEEEKQRREEEGQLNWASSGINLFNKVLRVDDKNMKSLAGEIIKALTSYLESQMGALYVVPSDKEGVEMVAHIGFNKEKVFSSSYVAPGDGLIGRAYLEKETIFISEITPDIDTIGSGLGKALPKSALIVPLIYNKKLIGLVELYSFKVFQQYQIAFVEKLSENIASTISTVKTNGQTAELLEKSKHQSEVLEQQEEEIRQNMEEMQAVQEESTQKEENLTSVIESLGSILPIVRYDTNQCVKDANQDYLNLMRVKKDKLIGKRHKSERFMNEQEQAKHDEFWSNLLAGNVMEMEEQIEDDNKEQKSLLNRFIPVRNESGEVTEIMDVVIDISRQKKLEAQIQMVQEGIIPDDLNSDFGKGNVEIRQHLIDLTHLNMVYKNDDKKIVTILKRYKEQIPEQISDIEKSIKSRNYKVMKMDLKALKTKVNYLGIKPIYDSLDSMIALITEDKDLTSIPKMFDGVKIKWNAANEELTEILAKEV